MTTRERIVAALSTVDSIVAAGASPDVLAPGGAWPVWVSATSGSYCTLIDTWHVFVTLPNPTMAATVEAADALLDAVWAALLDVGEVTLCEAATLTQADPAGTGQALPGLRYTLTTASGGNK